MAENNTSTVIDVPNEQNEQDAGSTNKNRNAAVMTDNEKWPIDPTVPPVQMSKTKLRLVFIGWVTC